MSSSVRWTHIAEHWTASHHGDRRGGGSAPAGGGAAMDAMISFAAKLAGHARTLPDRPAVTCGEDVLTYGELHRRSNRLARGLRAMGVREGDLVSVALPNGVDFVAVCHAIWKLGATRSEEHTSELNSSH